MTGQLESMSEAIPLPIPQKPFFLDGWYYEGWFQKYDGRMVLRAKYRVTSEPNGRVMFRRVALLPDFGLLVLLVLLSCAVFFSYEHRLQPAVFDTLFSLNLIFWVVVAVFMSLPEKACPVFDREADMLRLVEEEMPLSQLRGMQVIENGTCYQINLVLTDGSRRLVCLCHDLWRAYEAAQQIATEVALPLQMYPQNLADTAKAKNEANNIAVDTARKKDMNALYLFIVFAFLIGAVILYFT